MMESEIILTKKNDVITIHFPGDVSFLSGWDFTDEILNHNIDIVAYSNEFDKYKGSKTTK